MFYLIVTDANSWARGETLMEAFGNLFIHTNRTPTQGIIYEYEAEDESDLWVDELGWVKSKNDVVVTAEKHFKPAEIFQVHDELNYKIEEAFYAN